MQNQNTTIEKVSISILPASYGHWKVTVTAVVNGETKSATQTISDSRLIDNLKDEDSEQYEEIRMELANDYFNEEN